MNTKDVKNNYFVIINKLLVPIFNYFEYPNGCSFGVESELDAYKLAYALKSDTTLTINRTPYGYWCINSYKKSAIPLIPLT